MLARIKYIASLIIGTISNASNGRILKNSNGNKMVLVIFAVRSFAISNAL